jgi:uncharacterized membrane protein YphA (DoxX/SURF4 family)
VFIATVVVSAVLALVVFGSAMGKLTKQPMVVQMLSGLGVPMSWVPRLAGVEIAGGVGLLVGLAVAPVGVAAAAGLVCYFVGAVVTHLHAGDRRIVAPAMLDVVAVAALVLRVVSR